MLFLDTLVSIFLLISTPNFKLHMHYYPEDISCIDKALVGYSCNGVDKYWMPILFLLLVKKYRNLFC